jgi:hypothetical protein
MRFSPRGYSKQNAKNRRHVLTANKPEAGNTIKR